MFQKIYIISVFFHDYDNLKSIKTNNEISNVLITSSFHKMTDLYIRRKILDFD